MLAPQDRGVIDTLNKKMFVRVVGGVYRLSAIDKTLRWFVPFKGHEPFLSFVWDFHVNLIKLLTKTHGIAYHGDSQQPIGEAYGQKFRRNIIRPDH